MLKERRTYPPEFKREAVELMKNSSKPVKEIAEDLGIRTEILHRWKREQLSPVMHYIYDPIIWA